MEKAVITVVGKDKVGIIASVCNYLASKNINIMDISQTIVKEYFNMMMIVSIDGMKEDINTVIDELEKLGEDIGVVIHLQHENIFEAMHRI